MNGNKAVENVIHKIAEKHHIRTTGISSLAGGDINEVFLINTDNQEKKVIKINNSKKFPGMFEAEREGLKALANPEVIDIPRVEATGISGSFSYLLMEYRDQGKPAVNFSSLFGKQLAKLHKTTAQEFGFESDNYIGSLPQQNKWTSTASEFYISQRLEPQFAMARKNKFQLGNVSALYKVCEEIIPKEEPALIHGDLWNGNYLVNKNGKPCLIDPAVAYAPREMDLAMMKLFGGFDEGTFEAYQQEFPLQEGFDERIPLWQLYYLLVHLNIFGEGYKNQVSGIINRYT